MKCPYCGFPEQRVLDSRPSREGDSIRRRRECVRCDRRFTTFEEPEKPRLFVVKRDGSREEFARQKALRSMTVATRKRPIPVEALEDAVAQVERELFDLCEPEVPSSEIGERIMAHLMRLDTVAYVRFASVYREFETLADFREIVETVWLLEKDPGRPAGVTH
ncbi:MAG TPA: transcriptional regulator NrdR [Fimbriimonadaceae bacterium]|nr:transcriptional regulator NrdR [Fimbriimonadaceae bacterium]HRJ95977.1 transcriptional regulator NrdR [Fimbriimonadaceae bacterium]